MKLHGLMLNSPEPHVLGAFYTQVFGEPGWRQDEWYGFAVGGGNLMVGPHSEVAGKNVMPARIMVSLTTDDVTGEFERITALGAVAVAEPYQPDADGSPDLWLATVADPDNNYLQLSTPWGEDS